MKTYVISIIILTSTFLIDQYVKGIFLDGFRYDGSVISFILVFNKGVAFSMFAFLGEYLKFIQIAIIIAVFTYALFPSNKAYIFPMSMLIGAALSNIYDRFTEGGVVDYIFWHYKFEFAVFNLADVFINISVIWILIISFRKKSV